MQNKPLTGKTVFLTGSHVTTSVIEMIRGNGGEVMHFPLIETKELISEDDMSWIERLATYQWLIFTSQNAVASFIAKLERHHFELPNTIKIAAVGEKTAHYLQQHQLTIDFMPSIYSADVFVEEFQLANNEHALFLKGNLAKSTIRDGTGADEWNVYDTVTNEQAMGELLIAVNATQNPIIIFASPSAVDVFAKHSASQQAWSDLKVASIGHITTATLQRYGVEPFVQPKIYTMQAVIEQLILEETTND